MSGNSGFTECDSKALTRKFFDQNDCQGSESNKKVYTFDNCEKVLDGLYMKVTDKGSFKETGATGLVSQAAAIAILSFMAS